MSHILSVAQKARMGLFTILHRASEGLTLDSLKAAMARGVAASTQLGERLAREFPPPIFDLNAAKKRKESARELNKSFYLLRPGYKPTRNPVVLCHGKAWVP